jgi:hypothetical protein
MPDRDGQVEGALGDAVGGCGRGTGGVAIQIELVLEGSDDQLDDLP